MIAFMTAYLLVWLAVLAYVVRLGSEHRRLRRMAQTLQAKLEKQPTSRQRAA
jgi:CcmD family protein